MKKELDKLFTSIKNNKKTLYFLLSLTLVGIIVGSIFMLILDKTDKTLITEYLNNYIKSINNNKLDYLDGFKNSIIINSISIFTIWLLGISVIGIPIIIFIYFFKSFIIGFTISSLLINFNIKGFLIATIYILPHQIINLLIYTILVMFSLTLSFKIINSFIKKKNLDFKYILNKYLMVLIGSLIIIVLTTLYEIFIVPNIIKCII